MQAMQLHQSQTEPHLHTCCTCQANNLHQKVKNNFVFGGPQLWNSWPNELETIPNEKCCQQQMKIYLLNGYI